MKHKMQTDSYREQTSGYQFGGNMLGEGSGSYKLLGVGQAQVCVVQRGEYSPYFVYVLSHTCDCVLSCV